MTATRRLGSLIGSGLSPQNNGNCSIPVGRRWTPWLAGGDYDWLLRQVEYYCQELERKGKYKLYLWPPHCLLGSAGHDLAGVIQEARMFHAHAREELARKVYLLRDCMSAVAVPDPARVFPLRLHRGGGGGPPALQERGDARGGVHDTP